MSAQSAREGLIFVVGIAGIIHETVVASAERPTLILAFLVMMGVIPFTRLLSHTKDGGGPDEK